MAKDLETKLVLTAVDNASKVVKDTAKNAEKAFKDTERAAQQSSNAQAQSAQKAANATETSNKKIEQSYRNARKVAADVAKARETLGVRAENAIQREIEQTRAAYDRLKRSCVASQNELRRASEATKQRVRELNAELGKTSFGDKAVGVGRGLMNAGVGLAAGFAVTKPKMMEAAEYDMALARVADTGYSGGTIEEKTQGKAKIHQTIKKSLQYGGTKEEALGAINKFMSEGQVSVTDALDLLPIAQKNATATGASTDEISQMINSMLRFGVQKDQIQLALDYMNASGKAGGFELKDMAQYFPEVLASAGGAGLSGLEDLKKIGINLQQVYGVSGGAAQTATNLNNYFSKVKASSTADNIESVEFTNSKGKKQKINMKQSMQKYMKEGQNASEALLSIIEDILENDKEYQALLKQYRSAKGEDKKAIMKNIAKYIEGTKVAEIMPDLQAGLATYAMRNDQVTKENTEAQYTIAEKGNYNEESYKWIAEQAAFSFQKAKNNQEMTQLENFQKVSDMAAYVADQYSEFAQNYPNLNSALIATKDAVIAFGMALATSSIFDLLTGGKAGNVGKGALAAGAMEAVSNSKGIKWGVGGLTLAAAGVSLYAAAENSTAYAAQSEAEKEKHSEAIKQFHQANSPKTTPTFRYGMPSATPMPTTQYHGGYVIADRLRNNEIGQERVKQGSLSTEELKARTERNQSIIQGVIKPQVDSVSQTLSNYQADFQAFGAMISAGLEAGLAAQSHTIANQITVELDGSVVAEKVAEYQFNFNKRMA
ncbi:predicted tail length tape measure protein [Actinobacillus minor NM305]|uniref:Predicted tail length tape measure protein n=1 Tax=Actinobacillus minor NM305 TaxID=637911 RepID=C5RZZ3_9PAST|nr:phage tail tape measure protein [Actinobacillus minor]EER47731.1 predicted tail length tape measure protein [Actinobacillus minor NM305]